MLPDPSSMGGHLSLEQQVALLPAEEQEAVLEGLNPEDLAYDWRWGARPQQYLAPDDESWSICLALAGRGAGKTRMSTEWIKELDLNWANMPARHGLTGNDTLRIALLSRTAADVRDTLITGPSGLLNIYPPSLQDRLDYVPSLRRLTLPGGAVCTTFTAEEPDQLRGPEFHIGLADELAAHRGKPGADGLIAWDNLRIACRMGRTPQILATTTPKRVPLMRNLILESADPANRIIVRRMRTMDNPFLSDAYLGVLTGLYAGTSIGAQELDGEMLEDVVGALIKPSAIDNHRVDRLPDDFFTGRWNRIVGVDPSVSNKPGDECGIVVVGARMVHPIHERQGFVVDDRSVQGSPTVWAEAAVRAAVDYDASIVVESNQGGSMASLVIRNVARDMGLNPPAIREVWASGSKKTRAEPLGTAYERGRIHHINTFPELESQLTEWVEGESGYSPDRMDALVWAMSPLLYPETLKRGGLPGSARSVSPNRIRAGMGLTRQVNVARSGPKRYG